MSIMIFPSLNPLQPILPCYYRAESILATHCRHQYVGNTRRYEPLPGSHIDLPRGKYYLPESSNWQAGGDGDPAKTD